MSAETNTAAAHLIRRAEYLRDNTANEIIAGFAQEVVPLVERLERKRDRSSATAGYMFERNVHNIASIYFASRPSAEEEPDE